MKLCNVKAAKEVCKTSNNLENACHVLVRRKGSTTSWVGKLTGDQG